MTDLPRHAMRGANCSFVERILVRDGYIYDLLVTRGPSGTQAFIVDQPPLPGDTLSLPGHAGRTFVVVSRDWTYPGAMLRAGEVAIPLVQVIVEAGLGPFSNEVVLPEPGVEGEDASEDPDLDEGGRDE